MKKNIFYNKKKYYKIKYIFIFVIFLSLTFFYYYINNSYKKNIFIIQEFNKHRYVILDNLGGKDIPDFGINILENSSNNNLVDNYNFNLENIAYSIQLYVSYSFEEINNKMIYYANNKTIDSDNLFIGEFNSNVGKKFILLYSNYGNRELAQKNCNKLIFIATKCLVINVQKLKNL